MPEAEETLNQLINQKVENIQDSNINSDVSDASRVPAAKHPLYYVGTLVYSKAGLVSLFMWIRWGDFCFTMMYQVSP